MMRVWLLATLALVACSATEGGNPRSLPPCYSMLSTPSPLTIPSNAPGVPLELFEGIRDGIDAELTFELTRRGASDTDWQFLDEGGRVIDASEPLMGRALLSPTRPFEEGEVIDVSRRVFCEGHTAPGGIRTSVLVTIGPAAPEPMNVGALEILDESVSLRLSPNVSPWSHFITESELRVDGEPVTGEHAGLIDHGDDSSVLWLLVVGPCDACEGCAPQSWEPGVHELSAGVALLGLPDPPPTSLAATFEEARCLP